MLALLQESTFLHIIGIHEREDSIKHQNYITFWVTIKLTTHNKSNVCVMYDLKLPVQLFGSNFSLLKERRTSVQQDVGKSYGSFGRVVALLND